MTKSTIIHNRIPVTQDEFINRMADTPEFDSKTHVVKYALYELQRKIEGDIPKEKKEPILKRITTEKRITTAKRNKKVTEIPLSQSNMTQSKGLQWYMRHHTKHNLHDFR